MSGVLLESEVPGIDEETEASAAEAAASEPVAKSAVIGVFDFHAQAEQAVKALEAGGFPLRRLSIIGKGYQSEEKPTGFYTTGDRVKTWGGAGLFWGGLWGLLFGAAFFWIPGVGPIAAAGPFVHLLVTAVEVAVVIGGLSAPGAALVSLGLPKKEVVKYEKYIKADRYLVIAHGTPLRAVTMLVSWRFLDLRPWPGHGLLRLLLSVVVAAAVGAELLGYRGLGPYLLQALLLSVLIAAGAWLLARLVGDFFDGLDDGRHGWQRALQGRLGAEEDQDRLPGSLWLRLLAAFSVWTGAGLLLLPVWAVPDSVRSLLTGWITGGVEIDGLRLSPLARRRRPGGARAIVVGRCRAEAAHGDALAQTHLC
jgi:hypothetical protein